jgi:hypothetical protein
MVTPGDVIEASQVPVSSPNGCFSTERPVDVQAAWLYQAQKVRDEALRLLRERFKQDLELATQLLGSRKPDALAAGADYANKLAADYLAESEKLFGLMSKLVQLGDLRTTRNGERDIGRTEKQG